MKSLLFVLAIALLADAPQANERENITGHWIVAKLSSNGTPKDLKTTHSLVIDERHLKQGNDPKHWVGYTLNPAAAPKQIDFADGQKGIYELDGDNLRICRNQERPADFQTGVLMVLKRKK